MYRLIYFIIAIFLTVSCSPKIVYVPVHSDTNVRDSVIVSYRDCTIMVPVEKVINIVLPNQESNLETSLAKSQAYTDSAGLLHHNIENKEGSKTKYVYKTIIEHRDSIVFQEKPYPVEKIVREGYVPWYHKVLSSVGLIALLLALGYAVLKYFRLI